MTPVSNNMTSSFGTALRNGLLTNTIRRRSGFCGSDRIAICCRRLKFQSCRKTLVCNYVGRDGGVVFLALGDVSGRPSERGGIAPSAARPFPVTDIHIADLTQQLGACGGRNRLGDEVHFRVSGFEAEVLPSNEFDFLMLPVFVPFRALRPTGEFLGAFEKLRKSEC